MGLKEKKSKSDSSSDKKKKLSTSGLSLREKMEKRKRELKEKASGSGLVYPKEGVTRIRIKSPGSDEELGIEVTQFYLGSQLGGIISPATFDEPCPFLEKYKELKSSSDEDDTELAKRLVPKKKFVIGGDVYGDEKGKVVDKSNVGIQIPNSVYQDVIDLWLDNDEWGDMTDPQEGYDIKITRSGKGKNDTSYTTMACQKKLLPKERRGNIDLESIVRSQIKSYEELEELLKQFLRESDDEEEEPKPKSTFSNNKLKDKKKKKPHRDI